MKILYSNNVHKWYLGINLNYNQAIRLQGFLNVAYRLGHSAYQVLANEETKKFEGQFNIIISHSEKDALENLKNKIQADDLINKIKQQ